MKCVVPFMHRWITSYLDHLRNQQYMGYKLGKWQRLLLKQLPLVVTAFKIANMMMRIRYVYDDKWSVYSVSMLLTGTTLISTNPENTSINTMMIVLRLYQLYKQIKETFYLQKKIPPAPKPISNNSNIQVGKVVDLMPMRDSGSYLKSENKSGKVLRKKIECPLCLKPIDGKMAALPTGNVFCLACIELHVETHGTCPITGICLGLGNIRQLNI